MKVKAVKLGDVLEVQNGFAFKKEFFSDAEGKPLIRIRDIDKGSTEAFYTGEYREEFLVHEGDYLIGMDGAFTCRKWTGPEALLNQRVCRLRNFSARVLPEYVFFGIQPALTAIEGTTSFVTVKHISGKQILDIELPLPDIHEQQRIVDILSRAEGISRLRGEAQQKAAELVPAIFLEMFGDPVSNPKGWAMSTLGKVVEEFRYGTSQKSGPTGLPVLRIPNVVGNQLELSEMKLVDVPKAEADRLRLIDGDFLFVRTNGNQNYVGRSAVFKSGVLLDAGFDGSNTLYASYLIRARIQKEILNPYFLQGLLTSNEGRRAIKERCKTSAGQFNINIDGLGSIPIFLPPIGLQAEFVRRCHDVFSIQTQQGAATAKAKATFDALLHSKFEG